MIGKLNSLFKRYAPTIAVLSVIITIVIFLKEKQISKGGV